MASWVPTASMTQWAPRPLVSSLTFATPASPRSSTMSVAPNSRASAWRSAWRLNGDDAFGAELLGGEDAEQAHRAVADDRDGLAGSGFGGDGGEPAGAEHVGGGQQGGDQVGLRHARGGDQGAVGEGDAGELGLGAEGAHQHPVGAVRLVAGLADLAGVVGGQERADDEVADLDGADLGADLLDDADVLVAHHLVVDRLGAAVGPQVAAADAGRREADDRIGRLDDPRVLAVLDPDVAGAVHDYLTHRGALLFLGSCDVSSCHRQGATTSSEPGDRSGWSHSHDHACRRAGDDWYSETVDIQIPTVLVLRAWRRG